MTPLKFSPEPLSLKGNPLPWLSILGMTLQMFLMGCALCFDAKCKIAIYIEHNIEINQEFLSAHPEVKCQLINSWCMSVCCQF